jgi:hypothetical protein
MTSSWRIYCDGLNCADYPGGLIAQTLNYMNMDVSTFTMSPYNLIYGSYEGGQNYVASSNGDEDAALYVSMNRNSAMGSAYAQFFGALRGAGLNGPFTQYTNFTGISGTTGFHGENWGLLEDAQQTTTPKYAAAINYINTTPCWWTLAGASCSH